MKTSRALPAIITLALALSVSGFTPSARAANDFFTNIFGGDFVNPFNWSPNNVPSAGDNANFDVPVATVTWGARRTNANAFFNISNGGLPQIIGTNSWLLTNSYVIGQNAATTSSVVHLTGELRVTNASGAALMIVGQNGRGTYVLNGGSVVADRLFATNNNTSFTNSTLLLGFGTLTTLHGSTIKQPVPSHDFIIGSVSNATASWNISGGTNIIQLGGLFLGGGNTLLGSVPGAKGVVTVTGSGTVWSNANYLQVGNSGSSSLLVVSNGAKVISYFGTLGDLETTATNNQAWIIGPGSLWTTVLSVMVGGNGWGNLLVISNGATVVGSDGNGLLGGNASSSNNVAWVTGSGSLWTNGGGFSVGANGPRNTLIITNGGTVIARSLFDTGEADTAIDNVIVVSDGNIIVTNATQTGTLEMHHGRMDFDGGTVTADRLLLTNGTASQFNFTKGTLNVRTSAVNNAQAFFVGGTNGAAIAALNTIGGTHSFSNGLTVRSNGILSCNGTTSITGAVTVAKNGYIAPGGFSSEHTVPPTLGKVFLNASPVLQGVTVMKVRRTVSTLSNDQMQVSGPLTYGGGLQVLSIDPTMPPALGDQFQLFSASAYAGSFLSVTFPQLDPGLMWTNKLLVDGSIQVVPLTPPRIASISILDTNVVMNAAGGAPSFTFYVFSTTNVALPWTNWSQVLKTQFDWLGNATFTNAISLAEPQRFYILEGQ